MKSLIFNMLFWLIISPTVSAGKYDFVIASDGSGDYLTIQQAINDVPDLSPNTISFLIKRGVYSEKIEIPSSKQNIRMTGEDRNATIISWDDYSGKGNITTSTSYTFKISGNNITLQNLTIRNTAGPVGQAVALYVTGDRCVFLNCNLLGDQDTLYAAGNPGRQYYRNCLIEGTTDFIFGSATAWFEKCIIHSKKNSYITAASTPEGNEFGYVFYKCKLTADPEADRVYLGRPWRDYANVVFLFCEMGSHIRPEGWHNWNQPAREKTAYYAEYKNTGPGSSVEGRVAWSKQLGRKEVGRYTVRNVLGVEMMALIKLL